MRTHRAILTRRPTGVVALGSLIALTGFVVPPSAIAATRVSASTFAGGSQYCGGPTDSLGTRGFTLTKSLEVQGGSGSIPATVCVIEVVTGVRARLDSLSLRGGGLVIFLDQGSELDVTESTLNLHGIQFSGDAANSEVHVDDSRLTDSSFGPVLRAGCDGDHSKVEVTDSSLIGTDIAVAAGLCDVVKGGGRDGKVLVEDSLIDGRSSVFIAGSRRTEVFDSRFPSNKSVSVLIGPDQGVCRSEDNRPREPCTPAS